MKPNTELEYVIRRLQDGNYPAVIKQLIEKVYHTELCDHDEIRPCRRCLTNWEDAILEDAKNL